MQREGIKQRQSQYIRKRGQIAQGKFGSARDQYGKMQEQEIKGRMQIARGNVLNENAVAQDVSQKTGLNIGQVAQILMMLAPIVMSYLGQRKQQENVGADGLGGLLGGLLGGGQAQQASAGGLSGIASAMLDSDHDGSALDDIASMAFNYIKNQ